MASGSSACAAASQSRTSAKCPAIEVRVNASGSGCLKMTMPWALSYLATFAAVIPCSLSMRPKTSSGVCSSGSAHGSSASSAAMLSSARRAARTGRRARRLLNSVPSPLTTFERRTMRWLSTWATEPNVRSTHGAIGAGTRRRASAVET